MYEECVSTSEMLFLNFGCVSSFHCKRGCVPKMNSKISYKHICVSLSTTTLGRKRACMRNVFLCVSWNSHFS